MDLSQILAFTFVAALLVMSPGPNGVLIARTVPTSGRAAGFANIAGFVAAFYVHGALSILGISMLLVRSAELFFIVKMLGAAYLAWLGAKALYEAWKGVSPLKTVTPARRRRTLFIAFQEGFLTNALNPKVAMFYLAAFPQFITPGPDTMGASLTLVSMHALCNVVWFSGMVLLMGRLTHASQSPVFQRWLKGVTGMVLIAFGVKLATARIA
jgi:threonine/homoserine/homoserine lactone efflux protein